QGRHRVVPRARRVAHDRLYADHEPCGAESLGAPGLRAFELVLHLPPLAVMSLLSGKVALVTGSSRGIGRAVALELARTGASVAVTPLCRPQEAEAVRAEIRAADGRAEVFQCDVGDPAAVARMVEQIEKALGPIDVLVNNAGITRDRTLTKMTL